jgi:hypothetical protein
VHFGELSNWLIQNPQQLRILFGVLVSICTRFYTSSSCFLFLRYFKRDFSASFSSSLRISIFDSLTNASSIFSAYLALVYMYSTPLVSVNAATSYLVTSLRSSRSALLPTSNTSVSGGQWLLISEYQYLMASMKEFLLVISKVTMRACAPNLKLTITLIVGTSDGPETFLASGIPDLQFDLLAVKLDTLEAKVNTNRSYICFVELAICESEHDRRLAYIRIAHQHNFE